MQFRLKRGFAAVAAIALALALLTVSMTAPVLSTSADFSIFNSGWNGTSHLAVSVYQAGKLAPSFRVTSTGTDLTIEQVALDRLDLKPTTDALIIVGPTKDFTSTEGAIVGDFVRAGGMLLLADDFGSANTLLEGMNATSRFSGDLVMDLAFEKQPEFSVCFDLVADPLTNNVSTILLNYPSSLMLAPTSEVLARSSIASWLDTNGDRLREWGEPKGPFPLLAREHLGSGNIVLLSDPSVLINGMSGQLNNSAFGANLMDYVCMDRSAVYFDESHRDFFDPVAVTMQFTGQISTNAKIGLVFLGFVFALWVSSDIPDRAAMWIWRKTRLLISTLLSFISPLFPKKATPSIEALDPDALLKLATKEHPGWRVGLLRYILRERARHNEFLGREDLGHDKPYSAKDYDDEKQQASVDKEVHALP